MARGDIRRTRRTVLLVAGLALISGCGSSVADTASARNPSNPPARSTEQEDSEPKIERDREAVLERFPELGDITGVEWVTKDFGRPSEMPGPTDFRVSGAAQLSQPDAKRLQQEYEWVPAANLPTTLEGIASKVPGDVAWKVSEGFTFAVTSGAYEASFFLDPAAGVMVFDAVNPSVASP